MNATCLVCHFQKQVETAQTLGDSASATAFAKELMQHYLSAPDYASSPYFNPITAEMFQRYFGCPADRYQEEKRISNTFVLERMDRIRSRIRQQKDPVYAGLQFSILGNYLDFSALKGQVSFEKLDEMLEFGLEMDLDHVCYEALCRDLETGTKLLYFTDNAGEIGFDRLFAEEIQRKYPHLQITFCVRGGPALNDATREDASIVGIPFPVIDSGTCHGGTVLQLIGDSCKAALESADVIIAKGMGNVETMLGCQYNVYHAFLVKCAYFMELFNKPLMTPMLIRQRDYRK